MKYVRYQGVSGPEYGVVGDDGDVYVMIGSPLGEYRIGARVGPVNSLKLLAPVEPPTIICVGLNYADHAAESGQKPPEFPLYFMKPRTALNDPEANVVYPK